MYKIFNVEKIFLVKLSKNKVTFEGIGLHTGKESKINIITGSLRIKVLFLKGLIFEKDNIVVASYDNHVHYYVQL